MEMSVDLGLRPENIHIYNRPGCEEYARWKESVIGKDGNIRIMPAKEWEAADYDMMMTFFNETGTYVLPTEELIDFLDREIGERSCIEIGAGNGWIGRELGLRLTDSKIQEEDEMRKIYEAAGQCPISYPDDVEKLEGIEAIRRYRPDCILCCFVTHKSPDLSRMTLDNYRKICRVNRSSFMYGFDYELAGRLVRKMILVGNLNSHKDNPVMSRQHREIKLPGLLTRGRTEDNRIFIWGY